MTFLYPTWLLAAAAAVPCLAWLYMVSAARARRRLEKWADPALLPALTSSASPARRLLRAIFAILAFALLLAAMSRPRYGYTWEEARGRGIDILFALDTSRSMLAEDVRPNRLERSKLSILDLLNQLQGDRVGLIAFAGQAFLQCPLTLDYDAFRQTLETLDTNVIPHPGTDLGAAISEAEATFTARDNYKILILITDGEDLEARGVTRAQEAAAAGLRIYTVGVGRADGELILMPGQAGGRDVLKDASGRPVKSSLDESTLRRLADATGGFYAPLTSGGLEMVYRQGLSSIPRQEREARLLQRPLERYQWPVAAAVFLLFLEPLVSTRRRPRHRVGATPSLLFLLAAGLLWPTRSEAGYTPSQAAKLFDKEQYAESAQVYGEVRQATPDNPKLAYNQGVSLFKAGKLSEADQAFREAVPQAPPNLQRDALFNRAVTAYQTGRLKVNGAEEDLHSAQKDWERSLSLFREAGALDPEDGEIWDRANAVARQFRKHSGWIQTVPEPPAGGSTSGGGRYLNGRVLDISAAPAEGWRFAGWEGVGVDHPDKPQAKVTVDGDTRLTAKFIRTWQLTVKARPEIGGLAGQEGTYDDGSDTPIAAQPIDGYVFDRWEGDGVALFLEPQTTVKMTGDRAVTAVFERKARLLVRPALPPLGQTTGSGDPAAGEEVAIAAKPSPKFLFDHWEGVGVADPSAASTTVTATGEPQEVVAIFKPDPSQQDQDQQQQEDNKEQPEEQEKQQQDQQASDQQKEKNQSSQEEQSKEDQAKEEQARQDEAEKQDQSKASQANPDKSDGETEPAEAQAVGVMTREEARRLLEANRQEEKKLPAGQLIPLQQEGRPDQGTGRDW